MCCARAPSRLLTLCMCFFQDEIVVSNATRKAVC
eukprot:COSAG03_NODE_36064_length_113_cov_2259.285714_1_plen_33_part_01